MAFPIPSFNPNIPVVTSAGGTSVAYKDPNSPESIMKKVAQVQAQAIVDTRYDVPPSSTHEPFLASSRPQLPLYSYEFALIGMLLFLFFYVKKQNRVAFLLLIVLVILFTFFLTLRVKRNDRTFSYF